MLERYGCLWTAEEDAFLRMNYLEHNDRELGLMLKRSMAGVAGRRAKILGLHRPIDYGMWANYQWMRGDRVIARPEEVIATCGETDDHMVAAVMLRRRNEIDDAIWLLCEVCESLGWCRHTSRDFDELCMIRSQLNGALRALQTRKAA